MNEQTERHTELLATQVSALWSKHICMDTSQRPLKCGVRLHSLDPVARHFARQKRQGCHSQCKSKLHKCNADSPAHHFVLELICRMTSLYSHLQVAVWTLPRDVRKVSWCHACIYFLTLMKKKQESGIELK